MQRMVSISTVVAMALLLGGVFCSPECPLLKDDPLSGGNQTAVLLESSDKSALVSFLGSIQLWDYEKKFVALKAKSISVRRGKHWEYTTRDVSNVQVTTKEEKANDWIDELTIAADCAELAIELLYYDGSYTVGSVGVKLATPSMGESSCKLVEPMIKFPQNSHYTCQNRSYWCSGWNQFTIARLEVAELTIELDRGASAKEGKFSKDPKSC